MELQTRAGGVGGPGRAGLRAGGFILETVVFGTAQIEFSGRGKRGLHFRLVTLSAFPCILLWGGPENGLNLRIPTEHIKVQ